MEYLTFHNGTAVPQLGLGTWQSPASHVTNAVVFAIRDAGYRHIDCAAVYKNEPAVGDAFSQLFQRVVPREDVFVTSKLWNSAHHPHDVRPACLQTLKDLELEYLDVYLMHWGIATRGGLGGNSKKMDHLAPVSIQETWHAMEKLVDEGLVRHIGVSNFTGIMLVDLLTYARYRPVMNQIELHPYNVQERLVQFCQGMGMCVTAYSPLGRPGNAITEAEPDEKAHHLFNEPIIKDVAASLGKTPAQVVLRWAVERGVCVIPKSTSEEHIMGNSKIFDFALTNEQMHRISSLDEHFRFVDPIAWDEVPYFD